MELENGKLASTIKTFCKRASAEASEKYVHQIREDRSTESNVSTKGKKGRWDTNWSRWLSNPAFTSEVNRLSHTQQIVSQIHNVEKGVTGEVGRLKECGVYPTAELALIRRQFKKISEEWGDGGEREELEMELEFCERKRQLLRHRRMEVEGELGLDGVGNREGGKEEGMFFAPGQGEVRLGEQRHAGEERGEGRNRRQHSQQDHMIQRERNEGEVRAEVVDAVRQHHPAIRTEQSPYTMNGLRGKERADGMRRSRRK